MERHGTALPAGGTALDMATVALGLPGFVLIAAAEYAGELELLIETTASRTGCPRCGVVATLPSVQLGLDPPSGSRPTSRAGSGRSCYFRHGVSAATFGYLRHYTWRRVVDWLRHKHRRAGWKQLRRRYLTGVGLWPEQDEVTLFNPAAVKITRYRYRRDRIPSPWSNSAILAQSIATRGEPDAW